MLTSSQFPYPSPNPIFYANQHKKFQINLFMQLQAHAQLVIQQHIHQTITCIARKRHLFSPSNFTPTSLKRTPYTQVLIDWIDQGISDAIARKYLAHFVVAIYRHESCPSDILESYTFHVNYLGDGGPPLDALERALDELEPVHGPRYLTIKLFFNNDAPADYVPEGFKSGDGHAFNYNGPRLRITDEQSRCVGFSEIYKSNSMLQNESLNEKGKSEPQDLNFLQSDSFLSQKQQSYESQPINPTPPPSINVPYIPANINHGDTSHTASTMFSDTQSSPIISKDNSQASKPVMDEESQESQDIRCTCGLKDKHFELLFCDSCENWLHTVCCGFFSNKDKRIPVGKYKCQFCANQVTNDSQKLALSRKILSVVYNEPIVSKKWLIERVGLTRGQRNSKLVDNLVNEGFIFVDKKKRINKLCAVKDEGIKKKLKEYFRIRRGFRSALPVKDLECDEMH